MTIKKNIRVVMPVNDNKPHETHEVKFMVGEYELGGVITARFGSDNDEGKLKAGDPLMMTITVLVSG